MGFASLFFFSPARHHFHDLRHTARQSPPRVPIPFLQFPRSRVDAAMFSYHFFLLCYISTFIFVSAHFFDHTCFPFSSRFYTFLKKTTGVSTSGGRAASDSCPVYECLILDVYIVSRDSLCEGLYDVFIEIYIRHSYYLTL